MKPQRIDHIGIAVQSIEEKLPFYQDILGMELIGIEEIPREKVRTAILQIGESRIELLESTSPDGPIAKHIAKRGEGIAHIAIGVENAAAAMEKLKANNIQLINQEPVLGAHNSKIFFSHPKETHGVLYEYCERDQEN